MGLLDKLKESRGVGFRFNEKKKTRQLEAREAKLSRMEAEMELTQRERRILEEEARYRKVKEKVKHMKRKSSLIWGIASGIGKSFERSAKRHRGGKPRSQILFKDTIPKASLFEPYPYPKSKKKKGR